MVQQQVTRPGADDEQRHAHQQEQRPSARDPEHHDEHREVQERCAQILLQEQDGQGRRPRDRQRSKVLPSREREPSGAGSEHLALVRQVRGQEDDDQDLPELRRLERQRTDRDPQSSAVDLAPQARDDRQQQHHEPRQPDRVRVRVEHPVVTHQHERQHERDEAHCQPGDLLHGKVRLQPPDDGEAERRQERGRGQQRGVRAARDRSGDEPRPDERHRDERPVRPDARRDAPASSQSYQCVGTDPRDECQEQQPDPVREACGTLGRRAAHGVDPFAAAVTSRRIWSTISMASVRSFAVIPSGSCW